MQKMTRWISPLIWTPLAVLTLQGLAFDAQALNDTNAELKEAAANRAAQVAVAQAQRPVQTVYVPATAKQLDGFKPVLPPERSLGLAMSQAHANAQAKTPAQPEDQLLAKAETPKATRKR